MIPHVLLKIVSISRDRNQDGPKLYGGWGAGEEGKWVIRVLAGMAHLL